MDRSNSSPEDESSQCSTRLSTVLSSTTLLVPLLATFVVVVVGIGIVGQMWEWIVGYFY
jgi:hypothetical protein